MSVGCHDVSVLLVCAAIQASVAVAGLMEGELATSPWHRCFSVWNAVLALAWLSFHVLLAIKRKRTTYHQHVESEARVACAYWLAQIGLCFFLGYRRDAPLKLAEKRLVVYAATFTKGVACQYCSRPALSSWVLLLLAEAHALGQWFAMSRLHDPVSECVAAHLVHVLLPWLLLRYGRSTHEETKPHSPHASADIPIAAATQAPTTSTSQTSVVPSAVNQPWNQPLNHELTRESNASVTLVGSTTDRPNQTYPPYHPVFSDRSMVCVKVATHHHPMDIRRYALDNVARAVKRLEVDCTSGSGVVLSASVRYGCILISLETRNMVPANASSGYVLSCAQQLLPGLLHELELDHVLSPGQYLSLQLGDHLVYATKGASYQDWVFTTRPTNSISQPKLQLAKPCPPMSHPASSMQLAMHTATFEIQMWCDASTSGPLVVGSAPDQMRGPANPPTAVVAQPAINNNTQPMQKPHLQLWVHCQGQYLQTTVQWSSGEAAGGVGSLLQVAVQLPSMALARHHQPDGPVARLQLLTAELWDGDMLLSSTPLMLDAQQHLYPSAAPSSFGWWGASACAAAGLVHEVAAMAEQVQVAAELLSDTGTTAQSHDAFVSDLSAWLQGMQRAAPLTCCDIHAPSSEQQMGLHLDQCQALSASLLQYTSTCKLSKAFSLLQSQQRRVLAVWQERTNTCDTVGGRRSARQAWQWLRQQVLVAACVRPCSACDAVYYDRLREYLRHTMVWAALLICSTLVMIGRDEPPIRWAILTVGTLHASWGLSGVTGFPPRALLAKHPWLEWLLHRGGAQHLVWFIHLGLELTLWTGIVRSGKDSCRVETLAPFMMSHNLFALILEYLHAWGRWPAWLVRMAMVLEAVAHTHAVWSCPSFPSWCTYVVFPGAVLVVPWVLDLHWRKLLMPLREPAVSAHGKEQQARRGARGRGKVPERQVR